MSTSLKKNADIAREARKLKKENKIKATWTRNCRVFIRLKTETFFNPDAKYIVSNSAKLSCEYFSESQFNKLCHQGVPIVFSTFHLNIRSLSKNYDCLKTYLSTLTHSFSVLAFSETWLTDDLLSLFPLSNYNSSHSCRNNRTGGGVSLYVSNAYNFISRKDLSADFATTHVESVFIDLALGRKNVIVGCIYRPPDSDIITFNDALYSTLENINKENKLCVLLGDFNINLLKDDQRFTTDFLNTLY